MYHVCMIGAAGHARVLGHYSTVVTAVPPFRASSAFEKKIYQPKKKVNGFVWRRGATHRTAPWYSHVIPEASSSSPSLSPCVWYRLPARAREVTAPAVAAADGGVIDGWLYVCCCSGWVCSHAHAGM